jgi:hypothetical protein
MDQWQWQGAANQKWHIQRIPPATVQANAETRILDDVPGRCINW